MSLWTETQMDGRPAIEQAKIAIGHVLRQARDNPDLGYYINIGTQSFSLLTEAAATLHGEPLEEVRRNCACPNARDPRRANE